MDPDGFTTHRELEAVENETIETAVRMQENLGLMAVTDGEFRRRFWHYDFMGALTGLELVERDMGIQFHGIRIPPIYPTIAGRLDFPDDHPMLDHFRYVASIANAQPKISIPGPSACHFRVAPDDIAPAEYADIDQLGIAPQCGFASTEEGNTLTEDEQKRKLELVVATAEAIWGGADC